MKSAVCASSVSVAMPTPSAAGANGGKHAVSKVGRGGERLAEAHRLASGEQHRICTGAADVGRDHIAGVALFAHLLPFV